MCPEASIISARSEQSAEAWVLGIEDHRVPVFLEVPAA
jgi:hypothetical protein